MDHQTLQVGESVEGGGGSRVDEGDEADVLIGNVANVVEQSTADDIADFLNRGLGVDVAEVDRAVTKVVISTSGGGDGSRSNRLLGDSVGDNLTVLAAESVSHAGVDSKVLSGILLLSLGDVGAAVLAVVDAARCLPLGLLWELSHSLDSVANRQEVDKADALLADQLDGINGTELAQVGPQLLLGDIFGEVAKVDIPGRTGLLNGQGDGSRHLGGLSPTDLDILTLDGELLQDGIRMEVGSRRAVQEGDEGAVLIRQESDRLNRTGTNMSEDFLRRSLIRDIAQIDGPRRPRHHAGGKRRADGWRLLWEESCILWREGGRGHDSRRVVCRRGERGGILLVERSADGELREPSLRSTSLEGRTKQELRRQKRSKLHLHSTRRADVVVSHPVATSDDGRDLHTASSLGRHVVSKLARLVTRRLCSRTVTHVGRF